jgi:1-aminocyclopropane-1-carboxylate synthase
MDPCYLFISFIPLSDIQDVCDPIDNPKGHIGLCVAENKLITEILAERFMHPGTATAAFSDSRVFNYNSFLGLSVARDAVAYFLAKRFYRPDEAATMTPQTALSLINPAHVAIGAGCAGILNLLFFGLGENGDACLIPAPYYAAFEKDMNVRIASVVLKGVCVILKSSSLINMNNQVMAGCVPHAVYMANPALGPTMQELDLAFIQAQAVRIARGVRWTFFVL